MKQKEMYIKTILNIDDIKPISKLMSFMASLQQYWYSDISVLS